MMQRWFVLPVLSCFLSIGCRAPVHETEPASEPAAPTRSIDLVVAVEAAPEDVFTLWTTEDGIRRFFAPAASIGTAPGEPYVIIFDPESDPEGAGHGTKGARIRSIEPPRSVSFGWTFPPFGPMFNTKPFPTWVKIQVEPFPGDPSSSLVHFSHQGFPVDPAWDEVYRLFKDGNWPLVLNRLIAHCRDGVSPAWGDPEGDPLSEVLLIERIVPAPVDTVWDTLSTEPGLESFLCEQATVELEPGGPFEIFFSLKAPEGQRGCEGCRVVDVAPGQRLAFTWNSPPSLPEIRFDRTNVIIDLNPTDDGTGTTVRLLSIGWGAGEDWDASFSYFQRAWNTVLDWLEAAVAQPESRSESEPQADRGSETEADPESDS